MINSKQIRNFCIIAHIDHGKSTLADRFIEILLGFDRQLKDKKQLLDSMDLEQERGITIKLNTIRLPYVFRGEKYIFNLIDTPGHVDFSYEVSRSLKASEGALLVVDATKGVQAQTVANLLLAVEANLKIIPIINKIDLVNAEIERVSDEIKDLLKCKDNDIIKISANTGKNVEEIFKTIVKKIPHPVITKGNSTRALICDSYYDQYRGVVLLIRIFDGILKKGDKIKLYYAKKEYTIIDIGYKIIKEKKVNALRSGEVGWLVASIKDPTIVKVGDTIIKADQNQNIKPLPGYKEVYPNVFCGLFTTEGHNFLALKNALTKIHLSDSSFIFTPETSEALGAGFRCGFLGLLHKEIIQERIEREYGIPVLPTIPSVLYKIYLTNKTIMKISNPSAFPPQNLIKEVHEPIMNVTIITMNKYIGAVMELCKGKRGIFQGMHAIDQSKTQLEFQIPLLEIIYDFFDKLKSLTSGYASFDYESSHYQKGQLVKLDILLNQRIIPPLSSIIEVAQAYAKGKAICEKLKKVIPQQQFKIPIQAAIGSKIIARETIGALKKNVTAKCYGGDVTRKMKLLEKQKKGKKRMQMFGKVAVPPEVFSAVLKI